MKPFWEELFLGLSVGSIVKITHWPAIGCISEDVWDGAKALCCAQLLHFQGALEIGWGGLFLSSLQNRLARECGWWVSLFLRVVPDSSLTKTNPYTLVATHRFTDQKIGMGKGGVTGAKHLSPTKISTSCFMLVTWELHGTSAQPGAGSFPCSCHPIF